jgi:hypothetical protein
MCDWLFLLFNAWVRDKYLKECLVLYALKLTKVSLIKLLAKGVVFLLVYVQVLFLWDGYLRSMLGYRSLIR